MSLHSILSIPEQHVEEDPIFVEILSTMRIFTAFRIEKERDGCFTKPTESLMGISARYVKSPLK